MLKRFLVVTTLAVAAFITITSSVKAADVYQTVEITDLDYPNISFYPRTLHVNQGDTLHLTIKNSRRFDTRVFIPSYNLDQIILKDKVALLDMCISNPTGKTMWFQISTPDGKKVPGYLVTCNYSVPIVQATSRIVDTSILDSIINYNKDFCYSEKPEPKYGARKTCPSSVRGCW